MDEQRFGAGRLALSFDASIRSGPYILDFYCAELKVAIEIDGAGHEFAGAYDAARDAFLRERGIHVIRVPAKAILDNLDGLLQLVIAKARRTSPRA